MIDKANNKLSIRRQCDLLDVNRSRFYYVSTPISERNLSLMNRIDEEFTPHPFTGVDRMVEVVRRQDGLVVNHERIRRLMRKMGLVAIMDYFSRYVLYWSVPNSLRVVVLP